ncbi:LysR family transcriptional regulator [Mesorhizobium sp. M5C.F.Ca.IN.020.14.1.1]|nr:LysR family transcriptional regulator [Mesorhizobium sp. M5C.F.Ca.IN.020.14.1.1]
MSRAINLRQIEAFKAVIENGTISRAAEILHVSQPNMSKLIAHLEADTGLQLFERQKGRLSPTDHAMRLYDEVGRIFAGVRQVENAVEAIRREDQGTLAVGVMVTLASTFAQLVTSRFLAGRSSLFCSIHTLSSSWIVDGLIARKLDVGLVGPSADSPYVKLETMMRHPLVCIMAPGHRFTEKQVIEPSDLHEVPFVAFPGDTFLGRRIAGMFESYKVQPKIAMVADNAPSVCEFVAGGLGVALVHPATLIGLEGRLVIRRFEPEIFYYFQLCRSVDSKKAQLVDAFAEEVRRVAAEISQKIIA